MTRSSFTGAPIAFNAPKRDFVAAYDPRYNFNKIIQKSDTDPANSIWSISPDHLLRTVLQNQIDDQLLKLTLIGKSTQYGHALWDVLFNAGPSQTTTACVFTARDDFSPIGKNRVLVTSTFMNFTKPITRLHLATLNPNDKIGIGLYDHQHDDIYVLLYTIDELCSTIVKHNFTKKTSSMLPAFNVSLQYALKIDQNDEARINSYGDGLVYDSAVMQPFVEWIAQATCAIATAYSWKAHFVPLTPKGFDRARLEARIQTESAEARDVDYEEFENLCRASYTASRLKRDALRKQNDESSTDKRPRTSPVAQPIVEVVVYGDTIQAKIDHVDVNQHQVVRFGKDTMGRAALIEQYLTGQDIPPGGLATLSDVMPLSPNLFGEGAFLRTLSINF